ncbi:hypothetical protein PhaeoP83_04123 (plasmid) [Phaeobacter inhibens]|uniref:Peptidase S8/S53 domain-containing protein n=1 Tax=Phaeobacter inhibens TaxID=221822 RepID=A0ABM6RKH9_9RHOB|nr:hypothetical protein PhaeoP83_04123 [Phaeobacter inhibens]AUQ96946.1 hypothetical protein PhaeoP66_04220 [Phaeobacter inhibens]AUR22146.1 hypothetical protein PhaeoP80_04123 [Phaeobacter inhibens]
MRPNSNPDSLEKKRNHLKPASAKLDASENRIVGLFVPADAQPILDSILQEYQTGDLTEKGQNPPNKPFVEPIEAIRKARLETFWTDDLKALPKKPTDTIWWEVWCVKSAEKELEALADKLEARCAPEEQRLAFPEHVVVPVLASRAMMELMLFARFSITELRLATDTPSFFVDDLNGDEQIEWTDDLAERIEWPGSDVPAVCLLDSGVNRAHSLIEPALSTAELFSVRREWGVDDTGPCPGHGTQMAGIALHGDLVPRLASAGPIQLSHRLESVKILPPPGMEKPEERFYGPITKSAVSIAEIGRPNRRRVFCMAVTNEDISGMQPSTWSAALDQEAAGVTVEDARAPRRLIVVSAGNAPNPIMFRDVQPADTFPIEDPAQAWNVVTVGGYTDKIHIAEPELADHSPLAAAGDLSPYTRTSTLWTMGRNRPLKPDIVMEAGNRAVDASRTTVVDTASLSVATTGPEVDRRPLVPFRATSAATAEAARLASRLMAANPDYWPETIRALMIHGAEWTDKMRFALDPLGKTDASKLLRHFGYGVPTFERSVASSENHLALVAQSEIQPYSASSGFQDCHYYDLPWPRQALEAIGDEEVKLKITLSYFVDPNPGALASLDPYRYQSFGLRFDLKRRLESLETFKRRVNVDEREDPKRKPPSQTDTDNWRFPIDGPLAGSLHCNEWTGPAAWLLARNLLCVKPVGGWWKNRADKKTRQQRTRYALVVSVKTANEDVELHTDINAIVSTAVPVAQEIEVGF